MGTRKKKELGLSVMHKDDPKRRDDVLDDDARPVIYGICRTTIGPSGWDGILQQLAKWCVVRSTEGKVHLIHRCQLAGWQLVTHGNACPDCKSVCPDKLQFTISMWRI